MLRYAPLHSRHDVADAIDRVHAGDRHTSGGDCRLGMLWVLYIFCNFAFCNADTLCEAQTYRLFQLLITIHELFKP